MFLRAVVGTQNKVYRSTKLNICQSNVAQTLARCPRAAFVRSMYILCMPSSNVIAKTDIISHRTKQVAIFEVQVNK